MKNILLVLLLVPLIQAPSSALALKILIDPGHGGEDHGAVRAGIRESHIVLAVSQKLARLLEKDPQFQVHLTRDDNRFLTLRERVVLAEKKKADLFLSIHANAAESPRAYGVEFFFQNQLPPEEEALYLAGRENRYGDEGAKDDPMFSAYPSDVRAILEDLKRSHRILESYDLSQLLLENWGAPTQKHSAIRQAPFFVLTQTKMPAVLVELGFVSHAGERRKLTDSAHQKKMAEDLYQALLNYKEKLDKSVR